MSLFWDERRFEILEDKVLDLQAAVLPDPPQKVTYFQSWLSQFIEKEVSKAIADALQTSDEHVQALRKEAV